LSANFPFAALVGSEALREALLWVAVDPTIGGVLVTGTRGTAKSTAVRALADLLPSIDVVAGDPTNRAPLFSGAGDETIVTIPTPFVELPVGASEDRVIGTLDVRALLAGERRFEPGLLARANRGVLYVDEVNLLPDHLVDVILDAAATGRNVVERDGASLVHDARIVLVGTMNPEEGELRPQLLDRFGVCVDVVNDTDLERRVAIVERRLAFEADPVGFAARYADQTQALRTRVVAARAALPHIEVPHASVRAASEAARAANVEGMRADLTIVRVARAIAALDGRSAVTLEDIERAAEPALAHRRREAPRGTPPPNGRPPMNGQPTANDRPPLHDGTQPQSPSPMETSAEAPMLNADASMNESSMSTRPSAQSKTAASQSFGIGTRTADVKLGVSSEQTRVSHASQSAARGNGTREIPVGASRVVRHRTSRVAALATLTVLALESSADRHASAGIHDIEPGQLRYLERRGRERQLVVFVVDASGSMAAAARMRAAKGVVCGLLEDAYRRRDSVALVAFRGESAEVLVPPTRSAVVAYRRLRALATGGRTPLARGLACARELLVASARRDPSARAHLVLVSDARANAPARDAFAHALAEAAALRALHVRALCVDTEGGIVRLRYAAKLAAALGATYRHLDDCSERDLGATVREWMATA